MKTIFITGASSGLGKAAARLFASKGWKVIATMRTPEKEADLNQLSNVTLLPMDVTDHKQINATVAKAISLGKIDVVFNNAGYGLMGPLEGTSEEQIHRQLDTNLIGVILVTQAFIPHFRENRDGLFLTTTSIGGQITVPFSTLYHATKWALEGFNESLAFELQEFNIRVKTIAPGGIATDFAGRSMNLSTHEAYQETFDKMLKVLSGSSIFEFSTAEKIAEVAYEAATDGKDIVRYLAGPDAHTLSMQRAQQGPEVFRKEIAKALLS
ncbi:SDR family oxidoreductase [Cytophagaceae bacterium YF14B1]|uniref:SDR family oxidoreductase n=1 Tax=Xanthocytophaga flava TaxID=3048013 RepID=A0AAE3QTB5_9BACT|nr:SDR family oxidoreductase [Xanthocytophaga flavus]MDJ1472618.1 SDR family oxidoreductase [Xanthocytophaga flavus]MDJ1485077.1 SDR family oxidoreductase [Xanthocytophaga flavus]